MFLRAKMKITINFKNRNMKFNRTKKIATAIVLFTINTFLCLTAEAQWETKYYVDDFGEPTDEKYELMIANGSFSNSATTNSKAMYGFIKNEESLTVNVYEYNSKLATSIESTFETVKIKQPNGNVVTINSVFFSKSGKLYFDKDQFSEIIDAINDSGNYTMVFGRNGNYSKSSYTVKFTID